MSKCFQCRQKKAKRACPALGRELCPLCCGLLRDKEIHCPSGCRYLAEHKPYQEKRILGKKDSAAPRSSLPQDDILKDNRLAWLALHIEAPLMETGRKNPSFTDSDAVLALEYVKGKLEKGQNIIFIPGQDHKPKNEVGEAVCASMESCRYERSVILSGGTDGYKNEEKIRCLERLIQTAKYLARDNFQGRAYIERLFEQFAQMEDASRQSKILTPG